MHLGSIVETLGSGAAIFTGIPEQISPPRNFWSCTEVWASPKILPPNFEGIYTIESDATLSPITRRDWAGVRPASQAYPDPLLSFRAAFAADAQPTEAETAVWNQMTNPAIQNDFSYYRRTISRNRINNLQLDAESEVNNEMANRMSLFYAEATPMLKTLSNATTKFVSEVGDLGHIWYAFSLGGWKMEEDQVFKVGAPSASFQNKTLPIEDTTDCLSTMACVCRVMLETPEYRSRFTNTETLLFCMRVMVGVIILYDHVHPVGAFAKTSKIDMKGCIKVLKDQPSNSTEGLLNALRYTTRHLNDDTTSKQIRALLQ
ncbi:hypothetical protein JD844_005168 [Phrynosoma platyrhinos]|uniref:CYRIA/CYRIB Rac1 binding domain-containing protein n=1 Tax=Phrynosoma platyrhinos TaxID=52577 RepID=A0ABQ7TMP4_PHRPL|nr:hypothetical protein JD844_005168 [Phrynosoma platyrhinos]